MVNIPTVKLSFQKQSANEASGYIYLIVLLPGQRKYLKKSLGFKIEQKHWDKAKECVKSSHPESGFINTTTTGKVADVKRHLQALKLQQKGITRPIIEAILKGEGKAGFIEFFSQYIIFISQERKSKSDENKRYSENNIKKWRGILNRLKRYRDKVLLEDPQFSDIDVMWMEQYEAWNAQELDKDTSLPVLMSRTRQILKKASDKGLFNISQIAGYRSPVYKNPDRGYLTIADIDRIWEEVPKFNDRLFEVVACFFLLECLSGLRFSDWSRFTLEKISNENHIKVRAKKNNKFIYIPYDDSPRLKRTLEYITNNRLICNYSEPTVNNALKDIAVICGIKKKLTTHVGRHTFATLLLDMKVTEDSIAEWMGVSKRTVSIYAHRLNTSANREYKEKGGL